MNTIQQQLAAIIAANAKRTVESDSTITTPEAWLSACRKADELAAAGGAQAELAGATKYRGFAQLSVAMGWTRDSAEQIDAVISTYVDPKEDKATASRLRCCADPHVRQHVDTVWELAGDAAEKLGQRRLNTFFSLASATRKAESKATPAAVAADYIAEREKKTATAHTAHGVRVAFAKSRMSECSGKAKKNGVDIAALFSEQAWAQYVAGVKALKAEADAITKKLAESAPVESDSTPAAPTPAATPDDVTALFAGLDLNPDQQVKLAALLNAVK